LRELTDSVHRDEVARAQQRLRIETHGARDGGIRRRRRGARRGVRPAPTRPGHPRPQRPRHRPRRAARADPLRPGGRRSGCGRPSASSPLSGGSTRSRWRSMPPSRSGTRSSPPRLEDLKASKRDLLDIVREIDERVEEVFVSAFHDTAAQFERVFSRLFPGGEGRLLLTDPDNMLTTGLEVEARPPGKKIKRLVVALRWGAVAGGGGPARGDLQGPAEPVLHHGRGRGGPRRHQPRPIADALSRSCATPASSSSSPTRRRRWRSPTPSMA
jgi:chromosome segregation protein